MFAMPQSGTGVSVEAVDPVFQVISFFLFSLLDRHLSFTGKNVGHVETDWQARDGGWMVSLESFRENVSDDEIFYGALLQCLFSGTTLTLASDAGSLE